MIPSFSRINASDALAVYEFLTSNEWAFHGPANWTLENVQKKLESGFYESDDVKTFWIEKETEKVGMIRLFDLGNVDSRETPLFDLRIATAHRKQGMGVAALRFLTGFVFENYPNKHRIEGTTRVDNVAMRSTFACVGYVKEAHYRQAWKTETGYMDCVAYGILRSDWERGCCTMVEWEQ